MPRRIGRGIELLADPTRRAIVAAVALGIRRPAELAREVGLSRPATTRQLRLLEQAGLIRWTPSFLDRRGRTYVIDPGAHGPNTAWLAGVELDRAPRYLDPPWSSCRRELERRARRRCDAT